MRYTSDEQGVLNNFAIEPKVYVAKDPSRQQQIRYGLQGGFALLLIVSLIVISVVVS